MHRIKISLMAISILVVTACASPPPPKDAKGNEMAKGVTVYTLTNLHPDPLKLKLYSANYQQPGLIPRCTAVKIEDFSKKRFIFSIKDKKYSYDFHPKSTPEGFEANLQKYFGSKCDSGAVSKLSAIDQKGIKSGKAMVGMSKKGVIYAIGYPPESTTPSTQENAWKYWVHRFNTVEVQFNGDKVSQIKN